LPVELIFSETYERLDEAVAAERRIKGWSRAKKRALANGDWNGVHQIVCNERITRRLRKG